MLWNIYNFFVTYARVDGFDPDAPVELSTHILDSWILSRLNHTTDTVTTSLKSYDAKSSALSLESFVGDLSLWYVRRSRDRIGPTAEDVKDKMYCYQTLYRVLVTLCSLLAPFIPYMTESMYKNLTKKESVHLSNWPLTDAEALNKELEQEMVLVRLIVERIHAKRKEVGIGVRRPLISCQISAVSFQISDALIQLIKDETNIKHIEYKIGEGELSVVLDTTVTPELEQEGRAREAIRTVQQLRKEKGCAIDDRITLTLPELLHTLEDTFVTTIQKETLATQILWGDSFNISTSG
jgi:isoleucyl-tRNA synthetase